MPRSGIAYAPELEWIFAARWRGLTDAVFRALDGEAQSEIIAAYRCQNQIDAVLAWENRPKEK